MNPLTASNWKKNVPLVNGLIYPDFRYKPIQNVPAQRQLPFTLELADYDNIPVSEDTPRIEVFSESQVISSRHATKIVVGEGSQGADGFIAALSLDEAEKFLWCLFMDFSNPFVSVEVKDDEIITINNLDEEWRLNIATPSKINVCKV